jgi:ketosteroid isomerase-like protein
VSNVPKVQSLYASFGRGDVPAILELLAADVDWEYGSVDNGVPWIQRRRGRENVTGFFQAVAEHLDFQKFEPTVFLEAPGVVVALCDVEFTVKGTGRRHVETDEPHIFRFDSLGRIVKFRHAPDTYGQTMAYRG